MGRYSGFLRLKIYRRTFFLYVAILLVFSSVLMAVFYRNVQATALRDFEADTALAFRETETRLQGTARDIDAFFTRLYASPSLLEDFYLFFGATPAEYTEHRLESPYHLNETYLDLCDDLVYNSNYTIRHILYYSTSNLVEMEYTDSGYCRQKLIDMAQAEQMCKQGCVYTKDIHRDLAYIGKVSFLLDVGELVAEPFCTGDGRGIWLCVQENSTALGENVPALAQVTHSGMGIAAGSSPLTFYCAHASEKFGYTAIYTAPAGPYLREPLLQFGLLTVGIVVVFGLLSWLLTRQFSRDADYLEAVLRSMELAQKDQFLPVETQGRDDEFSDVAEHLNALYHHLDVLIQQKYELTIHQQQAQMDMLSAQLNPHFLYNTLERIRMRAMLDGAGDVAQATADLGLLYRNIVKTEPIITIGREIEITRQYLDLMGFLYGEEFLYHIDISPELFQMPTPKIWMQPIVENFFKHNFRKNEQLKVVVINGEKIGSVSRFQIFDNLGHVEPQKLQALNAMLSGEITQSSGVGLQNVCHRLRLFYGQRLKMVIRNADPAGVCIEIQIQDKEKGD